MKKIPLTQGQFALVDDSDYEWLMQWKWQAHWNPHTRSFYANMGWRETTDAPQKTIIMHRFILGLQIGDKRQGDHKNHNTLDNRRFNLRIVTTQGNSWNRKATVGYYWVPKARKYRAIIGVNGNNIHLGYHITPESARKAYLAAKQQYHQIS